MVDGANGNNIFILSLEKYLKQSSHTKQDNYYKILKYEYAHIVMRQFCGHN
jgi:hypothetical protein